MVIDNDITMYVFIFVQIYVIVMEKTWFIIDSVFPWWICFTYDISKCHYETNDNRVRRMKTMTSWQSETFSAFLTLCKENSSFTCDFPSQSNVELFSLLAAWTNSWTKNPNCPRLRKVISNLQLQVNVDSWSFSSWGRMELWNLLFTIG